VYRHQHLSFVRLPGKISFDCHFAIVRHLIPLTASFRVQVYGAGLQPFALMWLDAPGALPQADTTRAFGAFVLTSRPILAIATIIRGL